MLWCQVNQTILPLRKPCCYGADGPQTATQGYKYATSQPAGAMAKPSCPFYTETGEMRGPGFEPHRRHCVVVLEQETFILA